MDLLKTTQNPGVMVIKGEENNYYGILNNIVELDFLGDATRIVLFKCDLYDFHIGMKVDHFQTVTINTRTKLKVYEPFCLTIQAKQTFYTSNVSQKNIEWQIVIRTKARDQYDIPKMEGDIYQDDLNNCNVNVIGNFDIDDLSLNVDVFFELVEPDHILSQENNSNSDNDSEDIDEDKDDEF